MKKRVYVYFFVVIWTNISGIRADGGGRFEYTYDLICDYHFVILSTEVSENRFFRAKVRRAPENERENR